MLIKAGVDISRLRPEIRAVDIQPGPYGSILKDELRDKLGMDYDICLEADHIHIEYDPK
jgi:hypothetical protein